MKPFVRKSSHWPVAIGLLIGMAVALAQGAVASPLSESWVHRCPNGMLIEGDRLIIDRPGNANDSLNAANQFAESAGSEVGAGAEADGSGRRRGEVRTRGTNQAGVFLLVNSNEDVIGVIATEKHGDTHYVESFRACAMIYDGIWLFGNEQQMANDREGASR